MPLLEQLEATRDIFEVIKSELIIHQDYQYETGKWSPKDLLQQSL